MLANKDFSSLCLWQTLLRFHFSSKEDSGDLYWMQVRGSANSPLWLIQQWIAIDQLFHAWKFMFTYGLFLIICIQYWWSRIHYLVKCGNTIQFKGFKGFTVILTWKLLGRIRLSLDSEANIIPLSRRLP